MTRNRSSLDPGQIIQSVFNEESLSYDVTIIDTEMNLSLSADEGDSIKVISSSMYKEVVSSEEFNVENIDKMRIYISKVSVGCNVELMVSPDSQGDSFYSMWSFVCDSDKSHMSQCIENVMAKRAKVVCSQNCQIAVVGKGN